jgi:hypothetical protein
MWKQFDTVTTRLTGGTKEPRPCEQEGDKVPQERKERRRKSSADLVSFQEKTGSRLPSPVWSVPIFTEITSSAMPRVGGGGPKLSDPAND